MEIRRVVTTVAAILAALSIGCSNAKNVEFLGAPDNLGNGVVTSYSEVDASGVPKSIGVVIPAGVLNSLPTAPSDGHHCFDTNKDGVMDLATECSMWHEKVLPLPSDISRRPDVPFKWLLFNWNPHGHMPMGVWDKPHFDVHFYFEPIENVLALERGTCGVEFIRCDQFAVATKPVPSNYVPPNLQDVGAAAPGMGNHLIDMTASEFHNGPFTHTWIYGIYDGRVTFYENMVTLSYLLSKPNECSPIPLPEAYALAGYYPTQSCVRYSPAKDEYTVSIENFVLRQASPPASPQAPAAGKP